MASVEGLEEATRLLRELDPDNDAVLQRVWIADARWRQGDVDGARAALAGLVSSGATTTSGPWIALARITLGHLARDDGALDEACREYDAAERDLQRAPFDTPLFHAMLETARGHLAVAADDLPAARRHLAVAFALAAGTVDIPLVATVAVAVAWLTARDGAADAAAELLGAAHALRGAPDARNPDVAGLVRRLRAELDAHAYAAAYTRGRALDRERALAAIAARVGDR